MFFEGVGNFVEKLSSFIKMKISSQEYLSLQIEITNQCNLNCLHCYHSDHLESPDSLNYTDWLRVFDEYDILLKKLCLRPSVTFAGGEPLLSPYLLPLIDHCVFRWPNAPLRVLTNGVLLNESFSRYFYERGIFLYISMDGYDNESYSFIRGDRFDKVVENIINFPNKEMITLQTILSKRTSLNIEKFFILTKKLMIKKINFHRLIPLGSGENLILSGVDNVLGPLDLKKAYEDILFYSQKHKVLTNTNSPLFCLLDSSLGSSGLFGYTSLVIDSSGSLKVSSRSNVHIGNVFEEGLINLFLYDKQLKKIRDNSIDICSDCPFFKKCAGNRNASFAETGSFFSCDPACWMNIKDVKC